ncbi:uncharacterized protein DEA37_0013271, partial [Paragonimus westermani]
GRLHVAKRQRRWNPSPTVKSGLCLTWADILLEAALCISSPKVINSQSFFIFQFANQLGCVAGLKTAVTGITLVAIGTSLPDAFASRTAARLDESADNSIGNITGTFECLMLFRKTLNLESFIAYIAAASFFCQLIRSS